MSFLNQNTPFGNFSRIVNIDELQAGSIDVDNIAVNGVDVEDIVVGGGGIGTGGDLDMQNNNIINANSIQCVNIDVSGTMSGTIDVVNKTELDVVDDKITLSKGGPNETSLSTDINGLVTNKALTVNPTSDIYHKGVTLQSELDKKIEPASTNVLTNKTIDANNNFISNIGDSEISGGIDAIKIGSGNVDNAEFEHLNGVTSAIQGQINNKANAVHTDHPYISLTQAGTTTINTQTATNLGVLLRNGQPDVEQIMRISHTNDPSGKGVGIEGTLKLNGTDITTLIDDKANSADVYTTTQTDALLDAKANSADVYTSVQTDTLLNAKANSADVYTSVQTDTLLNGKANAVHADHPYLSLTQAGNTTIDTQTATNLAFLLRNGQPDVEQIMRISHTNDPSGKGVGIEGTLKLNGTDILTLISDGGGASSMAELSDVDLSGLAGNYKLVYDDIAGKWIVRSDGEHSQITVGLTGTGDKTITFRNDLNGNALINYCTICDALEMNKYLKTIDVKFDNESVRDALFDVTQSAGGQSFVGGTEPLFWDTYNVDFSNKLNVEPCYCSYSLNTHLSGYEPYHLTVRRDPNAPDSRLINANGKKIYMEFEIQGSTPSGPPNCTFGFVMQDANNDTPFSAWYGSWRSEGGYGWPAGDTMLGIYTTPNKFGGLITDRIASPLRPNVPDSTQRMGIELDFINDQLKLWNATTGVIFLTQDQSTSPDWIALKSGTLGARFFCGTYSADFAAVTRIYNQVESINYANVGANSEYYLTTPNYGGTGNNIYTKKFYDIAQVDALLLPKVEVDQIATFTNKIMSGTNNTFTNIPSTAISGVTSDIQTQINTTNNNVSTNTSNIATNTAQIDANLLTILQNSGRILGIEEGTAGVKGTANQTYFIGTNTYIISTASQLTFRATDATSGTPVGVDASVLWNPSVEPVLAIDQDIKLVGTTKNIKSDTEINFTTPIINFTNVAGTLLRGTAGDLTMDTLTSNLYLSAGNALYLTAMGEVRVLSNTCILPTPLKGQSTPYLPHSNAVNTNYIEYLEKEYDFIAQPSLSIDLGDVKVDGFFIKDFVVKVSNGANTSVPIYTGVRDFDLTKIDEPPANKSLKAYPIRWENNALQITEEPVNFPQYYRRYNKVRIEIGGDAAWTNRVTSVWIQWAWNPV